LALAHSVGGVLHGKGADVDRRGDADAASPAQSLETAYRGAAALGGSASEFAARNTRQQREGLDRLDNRFGTRSFEIVWVTEVFIRWQGEDICFWARATSIT